MKYKKTVLSICFNILLVFSVQASCYSEWNDAYMSASAELAIDVTRCQSSSWVSRCTYEANLYYGSAVESAGNEYYNCVNRR